LANIEVKEFKIKINDKEYTFRLDFRALIKFNNKFENGIEIFNNFLMNKDIYGCAIKILSCACIERDFTEDELAKELPFNFKIMKQIDEVAGALIEGIMGEKESSGTELVKNE